MRVLVLGSPQVPSYFNAGHHLPLFLVSEYLREAFPGAEVQAVDGGALNMTWKDLGDLVHQQFDVIAIMNDYDGIDGLRRTLRYARHLSPDSRIITFGRLSRDIPGFFEQFDLDAIAESGDYEWAAATFVQAVIGGRDQEELPGIRVRREGEWLLAAGPGQWLEANSWVLPNIEEIPYDAYDRLYARDENKFCGIPERRELVIPVARGCPMNCSFCDVPRQQGLQERRLSVNRVVEYIVESFGRAPFEYASMYAPTFTLKRGWVLDLCERLSGLNRMYPWKCTTTLHHLDEDLLAAMSASGCVRVSVGLETLDPEGVASLPRLKRSEDEHVEQVAGWCRANGIELNAFVILGMPGTTPARAAHTIARLRELGARVRPTIYTSYEDMRPDMTEDDINEFNRQLFVTGQTTDPDAWYPMLFGHEPAPTRVAQRIPVRPL